MWSRSRVPVCRVPTIVYLLSFHNKFKITCALTRKDRPKNPVGSSTLALTARLTSALAAFFPIARVPVRVPLWLSLRVGLLPPFDCDTVVGAQEWARACRTSCRLFARPLRLLGPATSTNAFVPHMAHADVSRSFKNEHPPQAQRCVSDSSSLVIAFPVDSERCRYKNPRTQ